MVKDDMNVIIYKILRYMYECMKAGERPELIDMCHDCRLFRISENYWKQILFELIEAGYVWGFLHRMMKDGMIITMTDSAAIIRAQQIMYVKDIKDKTVEKVEKKAGKVIGEKWEVQQAWDKEAKAMRLLRHPTRNRAFRGYYEEYIAAAPVFHVGVETFQRTWTSAVEVAVLGGTI